MTRGGTTITLLELAERVPNEWLNADTVMRRAHGSASTKHILDDLVLMGLVEKRIGPSGAKQYRKAGN